MSTIFIENIDFGTRLESIKQNKGLIYSPIFIDTNTTLSIRQFLQVLQNGLVVNNSLSNIVIITPPASQIFTILKLKKYQQVSFKVSSFVPILPNPNTVTIIGGLNVNNSGLSILKSQETFTFTLTCIDTSTPTFYLSFTNN